jgi:hypothetical protein
MFKFFLERKFKINFFLVVASTKIILDFGWQSNRFYRSHSNPQSNQCNFVASHVDSNDNMFQTSSYTTKHNANGNYIQENKQKPLANCDPIYPSHPSQIQQNPQIANSLYYEANAYSRLTTGPPQEPRLADSAQLSTQEYQPLSTQSIQSLSNKSSRRDECECDQYPQNDAAGKDNYHLGEYNGLERSSSRSCSAVICGNDSSSSDSNNNIELNIKEDSCGLELNSGRVSQPLLNYPVYFTTQKISSNSTKLSYTNFQLELLNAIYMDMNYPNSTQKTMIAAIVGITRDQVKVPA